jgi:hypothetical protein
MVCVLDAANMSTVQPRMVALAVAMLDGRPSNNRERVRSSKSFIAEPAQEC